MNALHELALPFRKRLRIALDNHFLFRSMNAMAYVMYTQKPGAISFYCGNADQSQMYAQTGFNFPDRESCREFINKFVEAIFHLPVVTRFHNGLYYWDIQTGDALEGIMELPIDPVAVLSSYRGYPTRGEAEDNFKRVEMLLTTPLIKTLARDGKSYCS
jgi:hypothetical protein